MNKNNSEDIVTEIQNEKINIGAIQSIWKSVGINVYAISNWQKESLMQIISYIGIKDSIKNELNIIALPNTVRLNPLEINMLAKNGISIASEEGNSSDMIA